MNVLFKVLSIAWCPNPAVTVVAIAWLVLPSYQVLSLLADVYAIVINSEGVVLIVNPSLGSQKLYSATDVLIASFDGEQGL